MLCGRHKVSPENHKLSRRTTNIMKRQKLSQGKIIYTECPCAAGRALATEKLSLAVSLEEPRAPMKQSSLNLPQGLPGCFIVKP